MTDDDDPDDDDMELSDHNYDESNDESPDVDQ